MKETIMLEGMENTVMLRKVAICVALLISLSVPVCGTGSHNAVLSLAVAGGGMVSGAVAGIALGGGLVADGERRISILSV
jgi:hypothetical protein